MKKALLVLACVSFIAVAATSCKKDCYCSGKFSTEVLGTTIESSFPETFAGKLSKSDCEGYDFKTLVPGGEVAGVTYSITCESK